MVLLLPITSNALDLHLARCMWRMDFLLQVVCAFVGVCVRLAFGDSALWVASALGMSLSAFAMQVLAPPFATYLESAHCLCVFVRNPCSLCGGKPVYIQFEERKALPRSRMVCDL